MTADNRDELLAEADFLLMVYPGLKENLNQSVRDEAHPQGWLGYRVWFGDMRYQLSGQPQDPIEGESGSVKYHSTIERLKKLQEERSRLKFNRRLTIKSERGEK